MQKTAFIWDLDGTLLDSYEAILSGIEETFGHKLIRTIHQRDFHQIF